MAVKLKKYWLPASLLAVLIVYGYLFVSSSGFGHRSTENYTSTNKTVQAVTGGGTNQQVATVSGQSAADSGQRPRGQFSPGSMQPGQGFNGRMGQGQNTGSNNYAVPILFFSLAFFGLAIAAYFRLKKKKTGLKPIPAKVLIIFLFAIGFLLRIFLAALVYGHSSDLSLFRNWANAAANNFSQFYSGRNSSDYPPLYIYVLYLVGKAAAIPALSAHYTLLLKIPSILADLVTSFLIYKLARKYLALESSILLAAFYIFNPAVLVNSTLWGQVDSFFTLIVVAAVCLLAEKRTAWAAVLFTLAVLMKPQGIIFLPVLFFELVRQKDFRVLGKALLISIFTAAIIVLPFSLQMGPLWIFRLFTGTLGEYPYASVNAFNFYSLLGANYINDGTRFFFMTYHTWGMIFIVALTLLAWLFYHKGKNSGFAAAASLLLITGVFTFSVRMHERYLFPAVALSILAFIYLRDKRILFLSAGFSLTSYLNTHFILFTSGRGMSSAVSNPVLLGTSLANIILFLYLVKVLYDILFKKRQLFFEAK
ncbi:MAG: DUF2029 domain-containing protein [Peptococcaceae bacterium]|nr:DUF2029 domain-containing protein [Peptococcaceae bacterium]